MMKRRGIQILMMLVLICTLGISACKQDVGTPEDNAVTEPEEEDSEEEAEKEDFVIGFSAIDMENPYFITLESAAREALEAVGCQMITKDPGTDPDLQASQIQEMIDEGIERGDRRHPSDPGELGGDHSVSAGFAGSGDQDPQRGRSGERNGLCGRLYRIG